MIMKKLREKERSGELKRLQEEAIRRSMGSIKNMKPVDGITTVRARAQRFIDPTVTYTSR
jgi:conjugal transfer pilus assembly protein TraW